MQIGFCEISGTALSHHRNGLDPGPWRSCTGTAEVGIGRSLLGQAGPTQPSLISTVTGPVPPGNPGDLVSEHHR